MQKVYKPNGKVKNRLGLGHTPGFPGAKETVDKPGGRTLAGSKGSYVQGIIVAL